MAQKQKIATLIISIAIGVAVISVAVFVLMTTRQDTTSARLTSEEDQNLIEMTKDYAEIELFLQKYPNASIEIDRTGSVVESSNNVVKYSYQKNYEERDFSQTIRLFIMTDPVDGDDSKHYSVYVDCVATSISGKGTGRVVVPSGDVTRYLQDTDCAT